MEGIYRGVERIYTWHLTLSSGTLPFLQLAQPNRALVANYPFATVKLWSDGGIRKGGVT